LNIETEKIPPHLRSVGTRVLVTFKEGDEQFSSGGYHYDSVVVTDFRDGTELGWFPLGE